MNKKNLIYFLAGVVITGVIILFLLYRILFGLNVKSEKNYQVFYIPTGASYTQVLDTLESHFNIKNLKVLNWVAKKKNYSVLIKPGRYIAGKDLSYIGLINLLRSGKQIPVLLTFSNARTINQIAGKIGSDIEADSVQILNFLLNDSNYKNDGFKKENIIALFIPDTYEMYWNTSAKELYARMLTEYHKFWTKERMEKAREKNLDPLEVAILASIIDDEVAKPDEKPRIAGVYLNRLKRGIPLQACPTIKFALNDFSITRVLKKHLLIESPYNTYKHKGFPPGPIGCPTIEGIDAVLNAEKNDYLFFVAKADFSGYHNFSRTLAEHNHYSALYQKELDRRKIFK
jgi:UPF0755 protein